MKTIVRMSPASRDQDIVDALEAILTEVGGLQVQAPQIKTPAANYGWFALEEMRLGTIFKKDPQVDSWLDFPSLVIGFELESPAEGASQALSILINRYKIEATLQEGRRILGPGTPDEVFFIKSPRLGHTVLVFGPL